MKRSDQRRANIDSAKEQLKGEGKPITASNISHILGVSESTVHRQLSEIEGSREGMRGRKEKVTREQEILRAAVEEAEANGFSSLSRKAIALRANVSEPLVNQYLGTLTQLKRKVMREAVSKRLLCIIAEGIATKNTYAMGAPEELKQEALNSL